MEHGVDRLVIGFDCTEDIDDTYLVVARETKDGLKTINKFTCDCAEDLYSILIGNDDWKNK